MQRTINHSACALGGRVSCGRRTTSTETRYPVPSERCDGRDALGHCRFASVPNRKPYLGRLFGVRRARTHPPSFQSFRLLCLSASGTQCALNHPASCFLRCPQVFPALKFPQGGPPCSCFKNGIPCSTNFVAAATPRNTANGELCFNRLCQPRGQAQSLL
jgi:hypothetical protein